MRNFPDTPSSDSTQLLYERFVQHTQKWRYGELCRGVVIQLNET
ncbi:MAG: hypothetical protein NWQ29_02935 [Alphaproteobacteria bacterium]|nr:hypothetical protein [Alphaproteobacteria bacterium]